MGRKVTMQQIADYLGVSKFVVSKALSGAGGVSDSTKDRVLAAAAQLGYFNGKNSYMKSSGAGEWPGETAEAGRNVLVLMPSIRFQTKDSLYWGKIVDGVSMALEKAGCGMVLLSEQNVDQVLPILNPKGLSGMIGIGETSSTLLLEIHRAGLPMVLVDHEDPLLAVDTVFANNFDSLYRLTRHLIGIGHRRLAFIGNDGYSRSFLDRKLGYRRALEEYGLTEDAGSRQELELTMEGQADYREEISAWLRKERKAERMPTALVCANDWIALHALQVMEELGLKSPEEVSVTGFDHLSDGGPALTTVHVPKEAMGRRAVERLLDRIQRKEEAPEKWLLSCEILFRETTAGRPEAE